MLELLFLLLPVAAGYGWIMGKNSNKNTQLKQKASLSKQYSAGLNFLLSDQEEKAVEHLIEFLDSENITDCFDLASILILFLVQMLVKICFLSQQVYE